MLRVNSILAPGGVPNSHSGPYSVLHRCWKFVTLNGHRGGHIKSRQKAGEISLSMNAGIRDKWSPPDDGRSIGALLFVTRAAWRLTGAGKGCWRTRSLQNFAGSEGSNKFEIGSYWVTFLRHSEARWCSVCVWAVFLTFDSDGNLAIRMEEPIPFSILPTLTGNNHDDGWRQGFHAEFVGSSCFSFAQLFYRSPFRSCLVAGLLQCSMMSELSGTGRRSLRWVDSELKSP